MLVARVLMRFISGARHADAFRQASARECCAASMSAIYAKSALTVASALMLLPLIFAAYVIAFDVTLLRHYRCCSARYLCRQRCCRDMRAADAAVILIAITPPRRCAKIQPVVLLYA